MIWVRPFCHRLITCEHHRLLSRLPWSVRPLLMASVTLIQEKWLRQCVERCGNRVIWTRGTDSSFTRGYISHAGDWCGRAFLLRLRGLRIASCFGACRALVWIVNLVRTRCLLSIT